MLLMWLAATQVVAQNVWERPQDESATIQKQSVKAKKIEKENKDAKYLRGAVPTVNGNVEWVLDVDVPGKSAQQIYDRMYAILMDLTRSEGQLEGSGLALVNKQDHIVVAGVREWLVFSNSFLSLDRAKFYYTLVARCSDGHLNLTMNHIAYKYDENGKMQSYKAEDLITDDEAVNKKNTRLYKGTGKFRRKTIDRKDYLFRKVQELVQKDI